MTYDITAGRRHELARELAESARVSFWDAMILRSAVELGCKTLWTEDLNAGQAIDGVRIANPFSEP